MADAYLKVKDNGAQGLALMREETDVSVSDLKTHLKNVEDELGLTKKSADTSASGWRLLSSGLASNNTAWSLVKYRVIAGETILIRSSEPASDGASFQFQSNSIVSASNNPYIIGSPVLTATYAFVTVPAGATWLILSMLTTDTMSGVYFFDSIDDIKADISGMNSKINLITNVDNIIVPGVSYSFTATGSGTWQSGYSLNEDYDATNRSSITVIADSANGYGSQFITLIYYSDAAMTNQIGRKDVDYSFNSNPYRHFDLPSGTVMVNIKVCLITTSFGDHTPSVGSVAYINGLTIYFDDLELNSAIDLPQLARLDQSVIYVLPETWKSKIQPIQNAQNGLFTFAIQTDTHFGPIGTDVYADSYGDLMNDLSKMTEYVGFDFIANLGDLIRGYTADTTASMLEAYTELVHRYVTNLHCPLAMIPGNHDTNGMYAEAQSDPNLQISKGTIYSKLIPFVKDSMPNAVFNGRSLYYYFDFDDSDIRVIFLNTTDGDYTGSVIGSVYSISDAQVTWFENVALDTDKKVILCAHVPLVSGLTTNTVTNGSAVMDALYAFKTGGGTVIGCFYGHTHVQNSKVDDEGILHVTFARGGTCAEVLIVDTANETIDTIAIGKATDGSTPTNRQFTY